MHGSKLLAILLKGAFAVPAVHPKPITSAVQLAVPSAEADKSLGSMETTALTLSTLTQHMVSVADDDEAAGQAAMEMDKLLLKLMQAACAAERHETALDAVRQLTNLACYDIAIRVANMSNLANLAAAVDMLKQVRCELVRAHTHGGATEATHRGS